MKPTIRQATASDAETIARLNAAFNDVHYAVEEIASRVVQNVAHETLFLAEIAGDAVGFLVLRILAQICDNKPYAEVSELFVEDAFRRQGVAQALMDHAVAVATEAGAGEIIVLTNFRNHKAQQFYFANQFENYAVALRRRLPAAASQ